MEICAPTETLDVDPSGPVLITETKFMQQYRVGSAAHAGGDIAAIRNGNGDVEVFTTGTDGTIWNYYPDPTSDTGYSSMSTGMVGNSVAAGVDAGGHIVLFAGNNLVISYVAETGGTGTNRWGPVQTAQAAPPQSPVAIAQIYPATIGGTLYVGVLTKMKSAFPGNTYSFSYANWNQNPGVFTFTSMTLSSLNCVWSGSNAADAEFTCLDQAYLGFEVATNSVTHYPMAAPFTSLGIDTILSSGANQYFAVLNDGNLYTLIGGGGKSYSWAQITQGMSLRDVVAELDLSGNAHLFALSTDSRIYHVTTDATGRWSNPMPIQTGQALVSAVGGNMGNVELFLVGTAQASMTRMILDEETGDWEPSAIEVQTSGKVEEFISYSTDITVTDAAGAPLSGAGIKVLASAQTQLSVNGATYVVDPYNPANLTTNAAGRLSITQPTTSLGVPTLEFNVIGQSPLGQNSAVRQFAGVQNQLGGVTSQEMMDAKDANGAYILQDQYRTPSSTAALAQACNQCMKLANSPLVKLDHHPLLPRARKLGVGLCMPGQTANLNRISVPDDFQHWQIDFSSGQPVFRILTPEDARALVAAKRALHAEGIFDFIGSIGDFVEGIVDGVVDVLSTVVTAVGNAVHAVITFVVDGVTYLYNAVVNFVEQAFDLIESIFAAVKLFFEKIFEWLGFLFAWQDILRTHQVYAYAANQFLTFLGDAAAGVQRWVDAGFTTVQGEIDTIFDQLVADVGANSAGGYINSNQPSSPTFDQAANNNIVFNATIDNASSASSSSSIAALASGGAGGAFDPIVVALQNLATSVTGLPQWQQAIDYCTNLGGGADNIFKQLLSALLRIVQGIIKAVLLGVQAVVDALLQALAAVIAEIQGVLTEEWDIPFVSAFYSWLTDSELTTLDLFCLILAIPATITYKVLYSAAPFPDSASVSAFEATFSAQTILANSGLGPGSMAPSDRVPAGAALTTPPAATPLDVIALNIGGMFSTWIYGAFSAIIDVVPVTGKGVVSQQVKTLAKWSFGAEVVGQALSCPWWTSSGPPTCTDKDGGAKTVWLVECVNVGVDAFFLVKYDAFAKNNDTDTGVIAGFAQGVGHCIAIGITGKYMSGWGLAGKIIWVVAELARPLRLTKVAQLTDGVSLVAMAAIDGIGYGASGLCSFIDGTSPPPAPPPPPGRPGLTPPAQRMLACVPGAVPLR